MKKILLIILIALIGMMVFIIACEIDHGLYPKKYAIKGTVKFLRGTAPENTDRLEVYALKEFPPQDPQNFLYLGQSGKLDLSQGNEIDYEIQVSPTSYDALGLIWKEKGQDISLTGLMGLYTTPEDFPLPTRVEVSKENPVVEGIDIYSDWNKVSKECSIAGSIVYHGEWPEDTQILLLGIYREKPMNETSLLFFENVDYTQQLFVESSEYRLLVGSGTYKYIVLFWVGNSISKVTDLIELGVYEDPENPGTPGSVKVQSSDHAENIDIHVHFDQIQFPN